MKYSRPVYIVAAQRTAIGRFGGAFKGLTAADLAVPAVNATVADFLKPHVNEVIFGQVLQGGAGMNVARQAALRCGLPVATPASTVNMVCASGLKAVTLGANAIAAEAADLMLAGGVESMSQAPYYNHDTRWGKKIGDSPLVDAILADGLTDPFIKIGMGETAEQLAGQFNIAREEQDAFALLSQQRTAAAMSAFAREIVPVTTPQGIVAADEHPRADTTLEKLQKLRPAFRERGTVTAGNSSGINDGAAMVLLAGENAVKSHALKPRARIVAASAVGCEPALMGLGPVHAIGQVCRETGWDLAQVDAVEINEAFAVQVLACQRELKLEGGQLNRRGGAIALGHPIGCSGARVLITLLHLMEDLNLQRGIASLCVGGGMGIAMAIER